MFYRRFSDTILCLLGPYWSSFVFPWTFIWPVCQSRSHKDMDCKSCIQRCDFKNVIMFLLFINKPEKNLDVFGRNLCFILTWLIIQINNQLFWRFGVCHDHRLCLDRIVLQRCDRLVLVLPICVHDVISTMAGLWQRVEHVFLCWRNDELLELGSLERTTTRLLYD